MILGAVEPAAFIAAAAPMQNGFVAGVLTAPAAVWAYAAGEAPPIEAANTPIPSPLS